MVLSDIHVIRGRGPGREADRAVTVVMLREAGDTGEPTFRAWTPHRQLAFGRHNTHAPRYDEAVAAAEKRDFPAVEHSIGGRTVAYAGTTVAFAHAVPLDDTQSGLDARYEAGTTAVVCTLRALGVPARRGEPPASYCPDDHSVQAGGKLCGLTQRVRKRDVFVSDMVVVTDHGEMAGVLAPVYEATNVSFGPDSVGGVADAGGPASSDTVCDAFEAAFVDDTETHVENTADLARTTDYDRSPNHRT